jgi:hypothetical protein
MIKFQIGDTVKWTSQAGGSTKTKEGRIVEIVPPGVMPDVPKIAGSRRVVSYVVEVMFKPHDRRGFITGPTRTKKPQRYWPLPQKLQLVSKPS